ncbi:MAG: hypothetical protein IJ025_05690 [Clostridia bacterium]|nr:hypothetical protein [Clostridia bacterium]
MSFVQGGEIMYKKMYLLLFNAITTALRESDINQLKEILKVAQIEAENIYINGEIIEK